MYKKYVTKVEETCVGPNSKVKDKKGILARLGREPGKKPSPATPGCKYISLFLHVIYTFCVLCCFVFLSLLLVMLAKSLLSNLSGVVVKLLLMLFGIA